VTLDSLRLDDREDLIAFLESLTGSLPDSVGPPPELERSGSKK
jgi:hypothetical protein